jgi:hypothetical protein
VFLGGLNIEYVERVWIKKGSRFRRSKRVREKL